MSTSVRRMALLLAVLALPLAGCGDSGIPELVPASGVVTYKGQPVAGAEVVFHSDKVSRAPAGTTDAQGKFVLSAFEQPGALVGDYTVTVRKVQANPELAGASAANPSAAYGQGMAAAAAGDTAKLAKNEIPELYSSPTTSKLTAKVTKEGPNEFTFPLE